MGDEGAIKQKKQLAVLFTRQQEQQRKKEYQQEIKEMHRRVKGRPLLLEQVAQVSLSQLMLFNVSSSHTSQQDCDLGFSHNLQICET